MTALPNLKVLSTGAVDFIDEDKIHGLLALPPPTAAEVRAVIAKSLDKQALTAEETSVLLRADSPELIEEIFQAARDLKRRVYGNRIVLFAPLYVGSDCVNDCQYCSFKRSNTETVRRSLDLVELEKQVKALEDRGHKRLILVWGEDPKYTPEHMAECVRKVYATKPGPAGEIPPANINAATRIRGRAKAGRGPPLLRHHVGSDHIKFFAAEATGESRTLPRPRAVPPATHPSPACPLSHAASGSLASEPGSAAPGTAARPEERPSHPCR